MPASTDSAKRAARLDELIKAVDLWVKARTIHVDRVVTSQQKIIDSRGSPSRSATDKAATVVVDELKEFTG